MATDSLSNLEASGNESTTAYQILDFMHLLSKLSRQKHRAAMGQSATVIQRYQTLPDGCIRLLSVQPSTHRDAVIECHLLPMDIDERPYDALSYVWGQEDPIHGIRVQGEELLVRPNLYRALKELRLADRPRTLWVDSICINQLDLSERNSQVRMMGRIFSSATQVVVWLGEADAQTDAAMDLIQGLSKLDTETTTRITGYQGLPWEYRTRVFQAMGMKHGLDNHDLVVGGLMKLMNNDWWKRIWTVQEIVLSKSATLRCGSKSVSWGHLVTLAAFAFEVAHHNTLGLGRPMVEAVFDEITMAVGPLYIAVVGLGHLSRQVASGSDTNLEELAWAQLHTRQATEPRDMIYALLGLSAETTAIEIDYRKSKKQVYVSAMKTMLEQNHTGPGPLHFLQDCFLRRDPTLPSWVPDFSILHSFQTTNLATTGFGMSLTRHSLYNASLGDAGYGQPKFSNDDNVLEMEGILLDSVKSLGDVCPRFLPGWESRDRQLQRIIDRWRKLIPKNEDSYVGGGSYIEAFWRTVTFDLLLEDRDYFAGNPDRRDRRLPKGVPGMPPTTPAEEAEVRAGIVDAPVPKTVLEKLGERCLFVTKEKYFGLGPGSMQAGDTVCLLRGSFVPTIIRPANNDRYTIVGEW